MIVLFMGYMRVGPPLSRRVLPGGRAVAEPLRDGLIREGRRQGNIVPLSLAAEEEMAGV